MERHAGGGNNIHEHSGARSNTSLWESERCSLNKDAYIPIPGMRDYAAVHDEEVASGARLTPQLTSKIKIAMDSISVPYINIRFL